MRIYQPHKNNPYKMPNYTYQLSVYTIRHVGKYLIGYDLGFIPDQKTIEAVKEAFTLLPEQFANVIFSNVAFEKPLPDGFRNKVTTLLKVEFIYNVAHILHFVL